jgi:sugar O-acyltransferase (sialic acid O-acetyltransferase NeuD family)
MILYGASGHGKVIADILIENGIDDIQFWDDVANVKLENFKVITTPLYFSKITDKVIISVGNNATRKKIAEKIKSEISFATTRHPASIISKRVSIGQGTVVMAGSTINIDCTIGKHCIINTCTCIDHDCILEDYTHISPNATLCGNVSVGEGTHIGAGSVVIQGINIGKWCTIGAGSVIIKDVPDNSTVVGNPGRIIKS